MSIDTAQVIEQAYQLIQSQRKFHLHRLTEQAVLRFFYAASELDLNSFTQLHGRQLEGRLEQAIKDRMSPPPYTTYAKQGHALAWKALLVVYREVAGESNTDTWTHQIAVQLEHRVVQEAWPISSRVMEMYLMQYRQLGTFDLFESDGRRKGRAEAALDAAWSIFLHQQPALTRNQLRETEAQLRYLRRLAKDVGAELAAVR